MRPAILHDEALPDEPSSSPAELWNTIDDLLDRASPEGIFLHGLGALEAKRLRQLGRPVPPLLEREERSATLFPAMAVPLVQRIRESCDGPLVLIKGPEVARLYPPGGRAFSDIDLLTPQPDLVQQALFAAGFVVDDVGVVAAYHLQPLMWPALPLQVEVHGHLKWPALLPRPALSTIVEASVPSGLGVDGVFTPDPAHHALVIAAHSWEHRPLRIVRDLLDIALLSAKADESEIAAAAVAWGLGPIWATTRGAIESLFYGGRKTFPLHSWARHIDLVRDRTVIESHLERWLSPFWGLPPGTALANTIHVLREEAAPSPGEGWGRKLRRSALAVRNARLTLSRHAGELDAEDASAPRRRP